MSESEHAGDAPREDDAAADAGAAAGAGAGAGPVAAAGAEAGAGIPAGDGPAAPESRPETQPEAPVPGAKHEDPRFFGISLHNLIFVGMVLGVVLGLIGNRQPHFDKLLLAQPDPEGRVEREGDVSFVKAEQVYVLMTPEGLEERLPATEVKEVQKVDRGRYDALLWWFNLFGKVLFLSALKMIIAPLILCSIVAGIVSLSGLEQLKRIGLKTLAYYVLTTCIAVGIGLAAVLLLRPGKTEASQRLRVQREAKLKLRERAYAQERGAAPRDAQGQATRDYRRWLDEVESREAGTGHEAGRAKKLASARGKSTGDIMVEGIIRPMLTNPFESLTEAKSLGIISFAVLLGVAIVIVGGRARVVADLFVGLNEVILWITTWLMKFAPFCVMCLVAALVAEKGPAVFATLAWYCITVVGGILVHVGVLLGIAAAIGGCPPPRLWAGLREALMIAFTTRSSSATLPVTLKCTVENLGVSPRVANFALPVGATMNMDGTALYEGVAVIFLIQIFGGLVDAPFELTFATTLVIFITAVLASVGAAAVPDAGLVTMVLVAEAVHLPVYYIPLIFAVDAFLDMFRTTTNVLGDVVGSLVVHRLEVGKPAGT
ncbi:MAG: dicarboxylate/amino acid:cation symporter [Planctomycetota bacterium]